VRSLAGNGPYLQLQRKYTLEKAAPSPAHRLTQRDANTPCNQSLTWIARAILVSRCLVIAYPCRMIPKTNRISAAQRLVSLVTQKSNRANHPRSHGLVNGLASSWEGGISAVPVGSMSRV
jgi:hypothetical protein